MLVCRRGTFISFNASVGSAAPNNCENGKKHAGQIVQPGVSNRRGHRSSVALRIK
jgi:hypothetical protein